MHPLLHLIPAGMCVGVFLCLCDFAFKDWRAGTLATHGFRDVAGALLGFALAAASVAVSVVPLVTWVLS